MAVHPILPQLLKVYADFTGNTDSVQVPDDVPAEWAVKLVKDDINVEVLKDTLIIPAFQDAAHSMLKETSALPDEDRKDLFWYVRATRHLQKPHVDAKTHPYSEAVEWLISETGYYSRKGPFTREFHENTGIWEDYFTYSNDKMFPKEFSQFKLAFADLVDTACNAIRLISSVNMETDSAAAQEVSNFLKPYLDFINDITVLKRKQTALIQTL